MTSTEHEIRYDEIIGRANTIKNEVLSRCTIDEAVAELALRLARMQLEQQG